jgi:hypothetical protein
LKLKNYVYSAMITILLVEWFVEAQQKYVLVPYVDSFVQLKKFGLLPGVPLRLHLGCGQQHFDGYINIDYPSEEHTVQTSSGADVFGDITKIAFIPEVVNEIRLHHVFEHFDRPTALALLCAWHMWLKCDGLLYIEVPDFLTSARMILDGQYTYLQKQVILRHIFGSHEASWAFHCDGWYKEKFEHVLSLLGFKEIKVDLSSWSVIHNVTVRAKKLRVLGREELKNIAYQILAESMVDRSEKKLFAVWCQKFDAIFGKMIVLSVA